MNRIVRPVSGNLLRRLALASIIANVGIVVTGGAVRLTASGLGCPTWPRCTDDSYVTTPEMGVYGVIEFGNRMLTFAVGLIALATVLAVLLHRPRRPGLLALAVAVFLGIPAQAVVGGITVLTNLNPWVVGLHFLASMAVIAAAYALWRRIGDPDGPTVAVVPTPCVRWPGSPPASQWPCWSSAPGSPAAARTPATTAPLATGSTRRRSRRCTRTASSC